MSEDEQQANIIELKLTLRLTPEAVEMITNEWNHRAPDFTEQTGKIMSIEDVVSAMLNEVAVPEEPPVGASLLEMSVDELETSVRIYNCLKYQSQIRTVGDLIQKTEAEMLRIKNFGKGSLRELKESLAKKQLCFGIRFDPESGQFIAVPGYRPDKEKLEQLAAINEGRAAHTKKPAPDPADEEPI